MPTYGYECKKCGHSFDIFQSMKDEPLKICPECGKELRRLINGGNGVIFKGTGFYVNDKNGKSAAGKPANAKSGDGKAESSGNSQSSSPCSGCKSSETPACPKAAGQ